MCLSNSYFCIYKQRVLHGIFSPPHPSWQIGERWFTNTSLHYTLSTLLYMDIRPATATYCTCILQYVYCILYNTYYMPHGTRGFQQGWEFRICSLIFRANHWFFGVPHTELTPRSWHAAYRTKALKLACRIES